MGFRYNSIRRISSFLRLSDEVRSALNAGSPIVALESAVITHGLPAPFNKKLEEICRENGVTPATIAIIGGKICVGLSDFELSILSDPESRRTKVSVRDIPNVISEKKLMGGTTVAATMRIAHWSGIRLFATGGIGGVHRYAEQTFDVSADLIELGRTPVAVICAGAKSILDIPKTLEVLETFGANVIVLDDKPEFPGFFCRRTTFPAAFNTSSIDQVAEILEASKRLNMTSGTVIACPLPESLNTEADRIEAAVETALSEASNANVRNKELTPFLLKRVNELTQSASLKINVSLLENNVRIASQIAKKMCRQSPATAVSTDSSSNTSSVKEEPVVLCLGASILDFEVITEAEPQVSKSIEEPLGS